MVNLLFIDSICFRIGDGFDLQKRILFRMGILEVIMLIFCWMLNHFYTHEKLLFKKTFYLSFLGDFLIAFYMVVFEKNLYRIHAPLFCLITALLVACAEEFIMRGMLLPSIMHHVHKTHVIWKGIFLSSFLFGVTHLMKICISNHASNDWNIFVRNYPGCYLFEVRKLDYADFTPWILGRMFNRSFNVAFNHNAE